MIHIAICDDEQKYLEEMSCRVKQYADEDVKITLYSSADDVKNNTDRFDIVILDVEIGNDNGLDLAEHFYNLNQNCIISIYSNHPQYAVDGYRYNVFRYILKQEPDEIKNLLISETLLEYKRQNAGIKIKNQYIKTGDIIFAESYGRTLVLHLKSEDIQLTKKISDIADILEQYDFIQCHKSYIVNIHYVSQINTSTILLNDGSIIPIGRMYKEKIRKIKI